LSSSSFIRAWTIVRVQMRFERFAWGPGLVQKGLGKDRGGLQVFYFCKEVLAALEEFACVGICGQVDFDWLGAWLLLLHDGMAMEWQW
jgi:hypothetical protein